MDKKTKKLIVASHDALSKLPYYTSEYNHLLEALKQFGPYSGVTEDIVWESDD
jgi:hypothetical protein